MPANGRWDLIRRLKVNGFGVISSTTAISFLIFNRRVYVMNARSVHCEVTNRLLTVHVLCFCISP